MHWRDPTTNSLDVSAPPGESRMEFGGSGMLNRRLDRFGDLHHDKHIDAVDFFQHVCFCQLLAPRPSQDLLARSVMFTWDQMDGCIMFTSCENERLVAARSQCAVAHAQERRAAK